MFKIISVSVLLVMLAGCVAHQNRKPIAARSDEVLDQLVDVTNYKLGAYGWPEKIAEICKTHRIPCGIEESPEDLISTAKTEILNMGATGITVRQVLDMIIARHPAYKWSYHESVLNIMPVLGKEYRDNNTVLLEQKVKPLHIKKQIHPLAARAICEEMGIIHEQGPVLVVSPVRLIRNRPVLNMSITHGTIRDALNEIVKSDPNIGLWQLYVVNRASGKELDIEYTSFYEE